MKINNIKATSTRGSSLRQRAFTLVELLLVLTILAILAGIVLPKIAGRGEQARETAAKIQTEYIRQSNIQQTRPSECPPRRARGPRRSRVFA